MKCTVRVSFSRVFLTGIDVNIIRMTPMINNVVANVEAIMIFFILIINQIILTFEQN